MVLEMFAPFFGLCSAGNALGLHNIRKYCDDDNIDKRCDNNIGKYCNGIDNIGKNRDGDNIGGRYFTDNNIGK